MAHEWKIAFAWPGLPEYASRCIRAAIDRNLAAISVVATRPGIPLEDVEKSLGQPVTWIDGDRDDLSWSSLELDMPDILFAGGYATPAFNRLAQQVRQGGGHVILMADNNWPCSIGERALTPLRHRIMRRRSYDGIFVPGKSGRQLARRCGYAEDVIWGGLYGADPALFHGGLPLSQRPKTLIYAGQFIERKNVLGLVEAFCRFSETHPDWQLVLCGTGPLEDRIKPHPQISRRRFVQPAGLAELMRHSRCLVLPSSREHWGLVVHEAALSGCALVLSDRIGAAADLATLTNTRIHPAGKTGAILLNLEELASWSDDAWREAEHASRRLAENFGPEIFAAGVEAMVKHFAERKS
ncbi:glycosyltransferase family 4 protein [Alphaproteobacteria bacterium LSUCC0684]